ncbi:MAG: FIST N-terminal domain-containing protein [Hyphomicrobiaceae bacterium]
MDSGWTLVAGNEPAHPDLILVLGSAEPANMRGAAAAMRAGFPEAQIIGCTTGGEILSGRSLDGSIVAAAIQFRDSHVHTHSVRIQNRRESFAAGRRLGQAIAAPNLKGVLLLAEGIDCDGSLLLAGVADAINDDVPIFGGLAGDGLDFVVTRIAANGPFESGIAVAVGLYGPRIIIGHGADSGWSPTQDIGAITNSVASIIYEIDNRPALDVLREFGRLGRVISSHDLLTVPLWIYDRALPQSGTIRTVVGMDEGRGSLVMAGDLPKHATCAIMHATSDSLTKGATRSAMQAMDGATGGLAFCVSGVGRKVLMGKQVEREVMAIRKVVGDIPQIGFYSYGEFGRQAGGSHRFLNQTMCVTIIGEAGASAAST